jgi:hypothetical protein
MYLRIVPKFNQPELNSKDNGPGKPNEFCLLLRKSETCRIRRHESAHALAQTQDSREISTIAGTKGQPNATVPMAKPVGTGLVEKLINSDKVVKITETKV